MGTLLDSDTAVPTSHEAQVLMLTLHSSQHRQSFISQRAAKAYQGKAKASH